jgi:hypothetical protein
MEGIVLKYTIKLEIIVKYSIIFHFNAIFN